MLPRLGLNLLNIYHDFLQRGGHGLVHQLGLVAFDVVGRPAVAAQQLVQFFVGDAGQHRRIGNLIAVEVQNGQHGPIADGVQKLIGMPGGGQGTGFGFPVTNHAGYEQRGVIKYGPKGVAERVAQLPTLVQRPRRLRGSVTRNAAGVRKLCKQLLQSRFVLADVGINLAVGAFQVGPGHYGRPPMAGTREVNHIQVVPLDDPVEVGVDEVLARGSAPVAQQHLLDVG